MGQYNVSPNLNDVLRDIKTRLQALANAQPLALLKANNLDDVADIGSSRTNLGIVTGIDTFTWPGASPTPPGRTINHGLARTPLAALISLGVMSDGQGAAAVGSVALVGSTQIQCNARISGNYYNPALNVTAQIFWVVIG